MLRTLMENVKQLQSQLEELKSAKNIVINQQTATPGMSDTLGHNVTNIFERQRTEPEVKGGADSKHSTFSFNN